MVACVPDRWNVLEASCKPYEYEYEHCSYQHQLVSILSAPIHDKTVDVPLLPLHPKTTDLSQSRSVSVSAPSAESLLSSIVQVIISLSNSQAG